MPKLVTVWLTYYLNCRQSHLCLKLVVVQVISFGHFDHHTRMLPCFDLSDQCSAAKGGVTLEDPLEAP